MLPDLPITSLVKHLKRLVLLVVTAILLVVGCMVSIAYIQEQTQAAEVDKAQAIERDTLSPEIVRKAVTVADILRNPNRFHNQSVWVKGYLHLEFEGDGLFWRKRDRQTRSYNRSVGIRFADSLAHVKSVDDYSDRYVILKGTYDVDLSYAALGSLVDITSLNTLQKK